MPQAAKALRALLRAPATQRVLPLSQSHEVFWFPSAYTLYTLCSLVYRSCNSSMSVKTR